MPSSPEQFLNYFATFLSKPVVYGSAPLSLLLLGLEAIIEPNLLCPCVYERNVQLIIFIFIGPGVFSFALMIVLLRPCHHFAGLRPCCNSAESRQAGDASRAMVDFGKNFAYCLIPPFMWIIILIIDGDYVACAATKWEGKYVSDKESNIKWCKPTNLTPTENETVLLLHYQHTIWESQISGYIVLLLFSFIIIVIVTYCDCCKKTAPPQDDTSHNSTERREQGGGADVELQDMFLSPDT